MTATLERTLNDVAGFSHEALFYRDRSSFVTSVVPFVREGLAAGEAVLVAVEEAKLEWLRGELDDSDGLELVDMRELGRNPARIIPAWHDFAAAREAHGQGYRGVGEPIWPGRRGAELVESQLHEALLNVAFGGGPAWRLLCPYDVTRLDPWVLEDARRNHPVLVRDGRASGSAEYRHPAVDEVFDGPLPEPPGSLETAAFGPRSLASVRQFLTDRGEAAGLDPKRAAEFVFAVNEVTTNSVRHGGGRGTLRVWRENGSLVCEVRDEGRINQPLVGRMPPTVEQDGGRGLWLANRLCDLVQVRSHHGMTTVRLHLAVAPERGR
ncbi:MAG TPA: sensor histidine kinase [Actinomycetota bacterium]|nr:sensor histidine kinase [Actinomycetota bacterium]